MTAADVAGLVDDRVLLIGGLVLTVATLIWAVRRVRKLAKSERPDEPLGNLFMLIGLGWSSEVIWEITQRRLHFPVALTLLLFFVFEFALVLSMIRAKRHQKAFGWPGRYGTTAWAIAAVMALVAVAASHSMAEALLRAAIPLVVTKLWWDGLVAGTAKRPQSASSWRWTPRRLLLWLGAIEPGERDVETVHRERLTQTMTRLEFRRRHGSEKRRDRAATKLARLSLTADDDIVAQVRGRVDRAMWFELDGVAEPEQPDTAPPASISAAAAASARSRRVRHGRSLRRVMVAHPRPVIVAAQAPREDDRVAQEVDLVVRAIKETNPALPQRQIARLAAVPETTVRRALRRTKSPDVAQPVKVNGRKPELEEVGN